ncbi:MAG: hypothetical protein ACREBW_03230 [Candidatus Micrarchaeaceae archaeon]
MRGADVTQKGLFVVRQTSDYTCRALDVTPLRAKRKSRVDSRTKRRDGYRVSRVICKLIETLFGDGPQHGAKTH